MIAKRRTYPQVPLANGEAIRNNRKPEIDLPTGKRGANRHQRRSLANLLNCNDVLVADLKPLGHETRQHPRNQIEHLKKMLSAYGVVVPIITDDQNRVVDGRAVVIAAKELGISTISAVRISHLSDNQLRALRVALNKIVGLSSWNEPELKIEIEEILQIDPGLPLAIDNPTLDLILDGTGADEEDDCPVIPLDHEPISRLGDQFQCGEHTIRCGNALNAHDYASLLGAEPANMMFADGPYNVPIAGHVTRSKSAQGHDFPMGKGELSPAEFETFLTTTLGLAAKHLRNGAISYVCIDWRGLSVTLAAGNAVFSKLLNLCVWHKPNAGMGSLYRSQHELVLVYKIGTVPHTNNVHLGRYGRNRTNVWSYVGQNSLSGSSKGKLALHPTVKPVAMIADAIRDCSNRGDIILDPFGGSGTTMIAAEKTGRRARLLELNPLYVDVAIQRWQRLTGQTSYHAETGRPYGSDKATASSK
jgi:DNA modification methylase